MAGEHWQDEPEAQDFPAAQSYLSLLVGPAEATRLTIRQGTSAFSSRW
jgi:hypothetical protein